MQSYTNNYQEAIREKKIGVYPRVRLQTINFAESEQREKKKNALAQHIFQFTTLTIHKSAIFPHRPLKKIFLSLRKNTRKQKFRTYSHLAAIRAYY